jgi:acetyl/propionyl-CoA carboxylase alpha subunit
MSKKNVGLFLLLVTVAAGVAGYAVIAGAETEADVVEYTDEALAGLFSPERGEESYQHLVKLFDAHYRLYDTVMGKSNLGDYDPGTNRNPWTFAGTDAQKLPKDAVITLTLTREEFIALKMPAWESIALGGPNHSNFLHAWMAYQRFDNARLRLALMEARGEDDAGTRKALETAMARNRKEAVDFLNTEPAD